MAIVLNFITNLIFINYLWVVWAALATWLWWIFIYITSEFYLGKKYFININYKFLTKNIFFMWFLWFFSYYYINPFFEWLSRWTSFIYIFIIWIIWFSLFGLVNIREFKGFILEVKRIKNVSK
jgi:hypothetical protein